MHILSRKTITFGPHVGTLGKHFRSKSAPKGGCFFLCLFRFWPMCDGRPLGAQSGPKGPPRVAQGPQKAPQGRPRDPQKAPRGCPRDPKGTPYDPFCDSLLLSCCFWLMGCCFWLLDCWFWLIDLCFLAHGLFFFLSYGSWLVVITLISLHQNRPGGMRVAIESGPPFGGDV